MILIYNYWSKIPDMYLGALLLLMNCCAICSAWTLICCLTNDFQLSRANQWANEFGSEQEQHGSVDDQWVNQFSKLHVDDWAEEFGNQVGEGILGDGSADSWANAYDE